MGADTLWPLQPHSKAKHVLLRKYLDAWLPILASTRPSVILVDGFAGPGRYTGNEEGSPLVMIRAYLEHPHRARWRAKVSFVFIEKRLDRVQHLRSELDALESQRPATGKWVALHGEFEPTIKTLMSEIKPGRTPPATFLFIDPFGYAETKLELTSRILQFPRWEVLVNVPLPFISRFVGDPAIESALANLYGDRRFIEARALTGQARDDRLHDLYRDALGKWARYVRSFEIVSVHQGGYHLFFATNNPLGLLKIKEAMWRVDPTGGAVFRDSTRRDQLVLFEDRPDFELLRRLMRERFEGRGWTSIEAVETFTKADTPYLPTHLRANVLRPGEAAGRIEVMRKPGQPAKSYSTGTRLRFVGPT